MSSDLRHGCNQRFTGARAMYALVEFLSNFEGNDNIVVYWRPEKGSRKGERFEYAYRLTWPHDAPWPVAA